MPEMMETGIKYGSSAVTSEKEQTMDLSIIVPACNVQGSIAACLRSVTRCPRGNIDMECIIVDDGSTDDTAAIVKRYIQRDSRIRLITKENGGISDTRNRGIEESKGRYMMFLDAEDGFCEDAWEQIEAAVGEEYADFVAFSYVAVCENGKLRARMLPISGVVSTDGQEAGRLMYADSVLHTCRGKLFRSDIVKSNRLTFRTDLPVGGDFLFVAEYFGNCESYMMTKAMILYHRKRCGQSRSVGDRLEYIRVVYEFSADMAERCDDADLKKRMQGYHLTALTDIFCEYAGEHQHSRGELQIIYQTILENETAKRILNAVDERAIHSIRRAYEYRLLKRGAVKKLCIYFALRSMKF